jgi:hypothetical protein
LVCKNCGLVAAPVYEAPKVEPGSARAPPRSTQPAALTLRISPCGRSAWRAAAR